MTSSTVQLLVIPGSVNESGLTAAEIIEITTEGVPRMPADADVLAAEEIEWVAKYILPLGTGPRLCKRKEPTMEPKILFVGRIAQIMEVLADKLNTNHGRDVTSCATSDDVARHLAAQLSDLAILGAGCDDETSEDIAAMIANSRPSLEVYPSPCRHSTTARRSSACSAPTKTARLTSDGPSPVLEWQSFTTSETGPTAESQRSGLVSARCRGGRG